MNFSNMQDLIRYVPIHFKPEDFLDRGTYNYLVSRGRDLWMMMDPRLGWTADSIWEFFNRPPMKRAITVNNWKQGGQFQFRGYRPPECKTGAPASMHRVFRAIDFDVEGVPAEEVRKQIIEHQNDPEFCFITRMEITSESKPINWNHIDLANVDRTNGIVLVNA